MTQSSWCKANAHHQSVLKFTCLQRLKVKTPKKRKAAMPPFAAQLHRMWPACVFVLTAHILYSEAADRWPSKHLLSGSRRQRSSTYLTCIRGACITDRELDPLDLFELHLTDMIVEDRSKGVLPVQIATVMHAWTHTALGHFPRTLCTTQWRVTWVQTVVAADPCWAHLWEHGGVLYCKSCGKVVEI